jgi:murein L,D-transpeptidase YafK
MSTYVIDPTGGGRSGLRERGVMAIRELAALVALALAALALAACQNDSAIPKDVRPVSFALVSRMDQLQMKDTAPILIRIFKEESALEVWKQRTDGQYGLLKTYSICKWSGALGPKVEEGDRQAPEGFYIVTPAQMNPESHYYLSFNIGYPNAYDRALGRTGSNLMVHGACSSSGCYSMTDPDAGELFALARDAFRGGQVEFQIEAFPFRMTAENLAKHRDDPSLPFWRMLKIGYDHFEVTHRVPKVDVCDKKYVFDADPGNAEFHPTAACPAFTVSPEIASAVDAKEAADDKKFNAAVARLDAAAAKTATAEQAAAERAAHPSLLARLMGAKPQPVTDATPIAAIPPMPRAAPTDASAIANTQTAALAATPIPRLKPDKLPDDTPLRPTLAVAKKTPPKATAVSATVDAAPANGATPAGDSGVSPPAAVTPAAPAAASASAAPPVGTIVKRKFNWPGDDQPTLSGATPVVPAQLGSTTN